MRFDVLARFMTVGIFSLSIGVMAVAPAQHRGYYFGAYEISNVEESGGQVTLTIKVVLQNYSGKELKGGGVILYSSGRLRAPIGEFRSINLLPAEGKVILARQFTVSQTQYAHWQNGEKPVMAMKVPGSDDRFTQHPVDLVPAGSLTAPVAE